MKRFKNKKNHIYICVNLRVVYQCFHAYGQYDVAQDGPHGGGRPLRTIVAVGGRDLLLNQTFNKYIIGLRKGVFDELMNISPGSSETQSTDTSFLTKFMHFLFESTLFIHCLRYCIVSEGMDFTFFLPFSPSLLFHKRQLLG